MATFLAALTDLTWRPAGVLGRFLEAWESWQAFAATTGAPSRASRSPSPLCRHCDDDLARAVAQRLRDDPVLRGCDVHVRAVYDGLVTLAGTVDGPAADLAAFEDALVVPGVRRVASEIVTRGCPVVARRRDAA